MRSLYCRIKKLEQKASTGEDDPIMLVIAPAGMQIPNRDRYIEANRRPGQRTTVINLLSKTAERNS
jgi:hypothetical protein